MWFKQSKSIWVGLGLTAVSLAGIPAQAQQTAAVTSPATTAASGPEIEEIIITARKTEESAQVVPVTVTALNQESLQKLAVLSVEDLQHNVPGLFISPNSQGGAPTFAIRAAKADNGTSDTVSAYIGDMPVASTLAISKMVYDMQSISTLQGPQGTLFGANSTGGAIIFQPNKPSDHYEGYIQGGGGDWKRKDAQAMINIPFNDVLQIRIAGDFVDRPQGFVTNVPASGLSGPYAVYNGQFNGTSNLSTDEHKSGRMSIRFKPTESIVNDLLGDFFDQDQSPRQAIPVALRSRYNYATFVGVGPGHGAPFITAPVDYAKFGYFPSAGQAQSTVSVGPQQTYDRAKIWDLIDTLAVQINNNLAFKTVLGYENVKTDTFESNGGLFISSVNGRTAHDVQQYTIEPSLDWSSDDHKLHNKTGAFFSYKKDVALNSYTVIGLPFDPAGPFDLYTAATATTPGSLIPGAIPPPVGAGTVGAVYPVQSNSMYERRFRSKAVYSQFSYDLSDELTATVGGRFTWDTGRYQAHNYLGVGPAAVKAGLGGSGGVPPIINCSAGLATYQNFNPTACTGQQSLTTDAPSFSFSLEDRFSPKQMAYSTIKTGYLVGGFNNQVFVPGGAGQTFAPEKVIESETGFKSDWTLLGRPIRANLAGFFGSYKDQQRVQNGSTAQGITFIAVENAGSSTFYGGNLEVEYYVMDQLELSVNYQHLIAYYNAFSAPLNVPGVTGGPGSFVNLAGHSESQSPTDIVDFSATFNWPVPSNIGKISTTANYFWRAETTGHDGPTIAGTVTGAGGATIAGPLGVGPTIDFTQYDKLPSYGLLDLTSDWRGIMGSKFDVNVWVKNVANKSYVLYNSNQALQYGYITYTYGNPREFGVDVRYNFF